MRFHGTLNVDVSKWTQVKMGRENNLKDFKNEEEMPKFGAGSEFGREQREEARRKKYGYVSKKYNPEDQPWVLRTGGKAGKRYRGLREGGVAENASYYIFIKAADGAFEAYPVEEWYNFTSVQRYKTLNAEEAEEEFGRRDKVLNYFSIMLRKRMKNEDESLKEEEADKPKKKNSKYGTGSRDLKISDMDDWVNSSEGDSDEEGDTEATTSKETKDKKGKKKAAPKKKKKKQGSDDEPFEDSDDGDDEGREVDYMSDESSEEEDRKDEKPKTEMQGVEDEDAIRGMEESESEEEKEEDKKENPEENKDETTPAKPAKEKKESKAAGKNNAAAASSSDSTSDTSDSDDDLDNDTSIQSALFMQGSKRSKDSNRSGTPTAADGGHKKDKKGHKRKTTAEAGPSHSSHKKQKTQQQPQREQPGTSGTQQQQGGAAASSSSSSAAVARPPLLSSEIGSDRITEDTIRRYLMRKPMTTTELLHKFKSKKTGLSREEMVNTIAQILKRLDPDRQMVKGKMYLTIR